MELQDIAQWGALLTLIGTLWWRLRQRDATVADEARRQQQVEDRLQHLETRMDHHAKKETVAIGRIDNSLATLSNDMHHLREESAKAHHALEVEVAKDFQTVNESIIRLETRLDLEKKKS